MENIRELQEKMDLSDARLAKAEELVLRKQSRNTELEINVSLLEKTIETLPLLNAQVTKWKLLIDYYIYSKNPLALRSQIWDSNRGSLQFYSLNFNF